MNVNFYLGRIEYVFDQNAPLVKIMKWNKPLIIDNQLVKAIDKEQARSKLMDYAIKGKPDGAMIFEVRIHDLIE